MSIQIDANEPPEFDYLLSRMGIDVSRNSINKTDETGSIWPDFVVVNEQGLVGVNRKQAVEAMGDLDKVEAQLMSELKACPKLVFMYEGFLCHHEDGVYAGDLRAIT